MDLQLQQRTALVTGATAGIGLGIAWSLAREGVRLVLTARRTELLEEVADKIAAEGFARPVTLPGDITDKAEVARIAREATAARGQVDILVNAAGAARFATPDSDDEVWDEAMLLNFTAARRLTQALLPGMRARRWGRVINLGGTVESRTTSASGSAKAALYQWAKGLATDIAAEGVTVNSVQPGRIDSEQIRERLHPTEESRQAFIQRHIPIGRFGEPQDIGDLVAFLASPRANYITGIVIPVDGGMRYAAS